MEAPPISIYKYMGPDIAHRFLQEDGTCSLKLSYLKDYNDPFEFFLTINYDQSSEVLAFYNEIISMVTQQPVTCFSKSPLSTPMWAHYASNSEGFAIQINEQGLAEWIISEKKAFATFGDIDYQDNPHELQEILDRAFYISKPRHIGWLRDAVASAAYFTKQTCWSYEMERRLIVSKDVVTSINENLSLLYFPAKFVTAIIAGAKTSNETRTKLIEISNEIGCQYYEKRIGRSTTTPFFINKNNETYTFQSGHLQHHSSSCDNCLEPSSTKVCAWCNITPQDETNAAVRNSFRMLHSAGILEQYLEGFNNVGRAE